MRLTYDLAMAAAKDAANASMRRAGRAAWSADDYNVCVATFDRLFPNDAPEGATLADSLGLNGQWRDE